MRNKTDWLDIIVNFASFAAMILVLTFARVNLPLKIVLAFAVSLAITGGWSYYKRKLRRRPSDLKRLHVYSEKNAEDQ
ncbi:hypothetical protein NHF46_23155 [Arthrobacter alpinus]|uniref:Uncharacterized protein n=1 Tax=Arthrobacter alpinus TaxID=656366 RepID=A0A0S2LVC6_9MICC|nr:hypothetical protein [Arthrobacter alpinus]ALO65421.1 hypothetical protein AS189_01550 [Arthrobacter alpinus]MDD0859802.1 hypothetical protein [Arthrobacter alpinus]